MKTYLLLFCFICSSVLVLSQNQTSDFNEKKSDQARNQRNELMNFVPNQVLVKFKDATKVTTGSRIKASGVNSVDNVLKAFGITSLEKLFPETQKPSKVRMMKTPQGTTLTIPSLDNIYRLNIPTSDSLAVISPMNIFQLIEELKALPEVEYAEPNYICSIDNLHPEGSVLTAEDVAKLQTSKQNSRTISTITPNDPLYAQQGYIQTVKVDQVWEQTQGDTTQVIAILDTGIDWTHPDLKNKIWSNPNPLVSPDVNGVVNDIRGWDFVNNDNNPMDDNSHGTHVAGITAAETNNGIGIAGVCPKAKIMPVKVFTNKGIGDLLTICKGINYASQKGATVINMSFASYNQSNTLENVLLNAYASGVILVASAGNDQYSIYDGDVKGHDYAAFPAALPFVFGVQSDGGYSNYDPDGPVFSEFGNGYNYELKAPGEILSTVPNGNYRILTGTSMAAPIVSGIISLYRSKYPEKSMEELWSDIIHSSTNIIDAKEALFHTKNKLFLDLKSFEIKDTTSNCDKDGFADAGETVDLFLVVRNTGDAADKVYVKIKQANDGNTNNITILNDSVYLGSIGVYRTLSNTSNPFRLKINPNCQNNTNVSLDVIIRNMQSDSIYTRNIKFKVFNGAELSGILLKDTTLTPDKNWVITNSLRISQGVTLTLQPGATLEIHSPLDGRSSLIDNRGLVLAVGTPDNKVKIKGIDGNKYDIIGGNAVFSNADIDLDGYSLTCSKIDNCNISNGWSIHSNKMIKSRITNAMWGWEIDSIDNSYFDNSIFGFSSKSPAFISNSVFDNLYMGDYSYTGSTVKYNTFTNIKNYNFYYNPVSYNYYKNTGCLFNIATNPDNIINNSFLFNDVGGKFVKTSGGADLLTLKNQYWGTINNEKIKNKYYDFNSNAGIPYLNVEPKLTAPSDSCPGHVWKVLVNGKDAQDEVVDPVGVGKQRFDVYFNRPMNKDSIPQVTFGGKYPYTSNKINEGGSWSADGKIYTVYKTIKLTTGDGVNQIRVAGAKQAGDWGWTIPVEDSRFSFTISAANSASVEFMAAAGLGKVKLEWNNSDLEDGLGYNMYRMEHINDSTLTSPVLINSTLITDTLYTDYSVTPNKKYYYYYKILRTNLAETDSSKVVSAIPFTAAKGDANGDLNVNVLDVTSIVAYLLNNNPQPFIFEAADINNDASINVLDIVGVVGKILTNGQKVKAVNFNQQATLYLQNDTLFADVNVAVGGIQFDISGVNKMEDIKILSALNGFESGYSSIDSGLRLLFYSLSGKSIASGTHIPLLVLNDGCKITDAIWGTPTGSPIRVNYLMTKIPDISYNMNQMAVELGQNYPNPVNGYTFIPLQIYEPVDELILHIGNMVGQEVKTIRLTQPCIGKHLLSWNPEANKGLFIYTLEINTNGKRQRCPIMKMMVQ